MAEIPGKAARREEGGRGEKVSFNVGFSLISR